MSHHGVNPLDPSFKDNWARELANLQERTGATGAFPHGKLNESDEGELAMAVGSDPIKGVVWIDFGKQTRWIGFEPAQVDGLCELLQKHKRAILPLCACGARGEHDCPGGCDTPGRKS